MNELEARRDFKTAVLAVDRYCIVHDDPRDCELPLQAHHVVTQQQLRKAGRLDLLWDPRNGATVCYLAHRRHTSAVERIPRGKLPERCHAFAREHGFLDILVRFYAGGSLCSG